MTIVVTGSVATDHLMRFGARFREQLIADQLDHISLSFLVEDLQVRRGGAAANICFGLGSLGQRSVLVAAVGSDFEDYERWLTAHQVDTSHVLRCDDLHTARFICTTDTDQNQIASFYPGAMARAGTIDLAEILSALGHVDLVVVSPDDPAAMVRHTRACRSAGVPIAADPSQQIARLEGTELRELVDGARYLFTNSYEAALLVRKTGWSEDDITGRVGCWVTTRSEAGIVLRRSGHTPVKVDVVPAEVVLDPTGVGDAFRAGFLAGIACGLDLEHAAMTGAALSTTVIETTGTQEYTLEPGRFAALLATTYGQDAAARIGGALRSVTPAAELEPTR